MYFYAHKTEIFLIHGVSLETVWSNSQNNWQTDCF